jgi:hypothetical protein
MINPVVEISQEDVKTLMAKLEAATRDTAVIGGMTDGAINMVNWIKTERLSGPRPMFLDQVTGKLWQSILNSPIDKSGDTYQGKIGIENTEAKVYGPVHEYGATIYPKNGKYLKFKIHTGDRFRSLRGGGLLKNPVGIYQWVQVRSVTIPARPFMRPAAEDEDNVNYLVKAISDRLTDAIVEAK